MSARSSWRAIAAAPALLACASVSAFAETPSPKSIPIAEFGIYAHPGDNYSSHQRPVMAQVDFGGLKRLNDRYALGGNFFVYGDDDPVRIGVKVRGRRQLGSSFAVDAAPGL